MRTGIPSPAETPLDDPPWQPAAEIERAEAERRREAALRSKVGDLEQFAYMAAHDLQEPLRMVAGYTELAVERYGSRMDPQALELLKMALEGARRMRDLVDGALATARGDNRPDARQKTGAEDAVSGALANLRREIARSRARISVGKLPAVVADPPALERIFQNLIGNAIRHASRAAPEISVEGEERARDWLFRVSDNGGGFAGRPVPGLGLQICARLVERHGGRLWTEAGRGATLCFTLAKG